jgi:hypothetical protein
MGAGLAGSRGSFLKARRGGGYPAAVARSLRFEPAVLDLQHADTVATGLLATNPDPEVLPVIVSTSAMVANGCGRTASVCSRGATDGRFSSATSAPTAARRAGPS